MSSTETQLASSTSSLSASQASPNIAQAYKQASELYLTRRISDAYDTIQPLLSGQHGTAAIATASRGARIKVWSLYISILNEVVEMGQEAGKAAFGSSRWKELAAKARDGGVWEDVVNIGYGGVEGSVDADVVTNLATLLLTQAASQKITQQRLEAYLAAFGTPSFDIESAMEKPKTARSSHNNGTSTPRDLNARLKIIEIYALHVLPRNDEWDYAREFITMSEVMDDERKEAFLHALQNLQDENSIEAKREAELQRQRQQQVEDTRRREAETQAAEKAKAEAEASRRKKEASKAPHNTLDSSKKSTKDSAKSPSKPSAIAGPSKSASAAHTRKASAHDKAPAKRPKAPSASSLSRAAAIMAIVQGSIFSLGKTMRRNPAPFLRILAFIFALLVAFARRDVRDRVSRLGSDSWEKLKATVGMGVKVSYV